MGLAVHEVLAEYQLPAGAVVFLIFAGSPAEAAGFQLSDVIAQFNDWEISHYEQLPLAVSQTFPGELFEAVVFRAGRYETVYGFVGAFDGNTCQPRSSEETRKP